MARAKSDNGIVKVKILTSLAGKDFSYKVGDVVELDIDFATQLINVGYAEKV